MSNSSFFRALKWSVAGEWAAKVIQPLIFIGLARILTPEDYGVVAAALMVISFTQVFWEAGMSKALIQRQTDVDEAANVAYWINLGVGFLTAVLLFLFADSIAKSLFHDQRVSNVLKVMTLQIFLGAVASVHTALLQKEMKFNRLFWVRLTTVAIPGLFSIPLALYGMSYWSLVVGTLVGQAAQVIVLWKMSRWRPRLGFNYSVARELGRFGFWVTVTGLLVWFFLWADSFIVGTYLGTHELGLYRTANTFVIMIFDGILFAPLLPVFYSYFSGVNSDLTKIRDATLTIIKLITIVSIPLSFLLFVLSEPVSDIIFGFKWQGIAFAIGLLSLMRGYSLLVGMNGEIYRSIGKPHYETMIYLFSSIFFLAGYLLSIREGFHTFIVTRVFLGFASLIPHFYLINKLLKIRMLPILKTIGISTVAGLLAIGFNFVMPDFPNSFVHVIIISSGSIVLTSLLIFSLEHKFVLTFFSKFSIQIRQSFK